MSPVPAIVVTSRPPGRNAASQLVGTEPRVLADAAIAEHRHLLAGVGVAVVGDPGGIFHIAEPGRMAGSVAVGLDRRSPAVALGELCGRPDGQDRSRRYCPVQDVGRPGGRGGFGWSLRCRLNCVMPWNVRC
jgi:hypothetical protein